MKTAIRVYFHDRNEETKETKTKYEIFFLRQKMYLGKSKNIQ